MTAPDCSLPSMSTGMIDFDDSDLTFRAHLYVVEWRKRAGVAENIPLGMPGGRYVAWTDNCIVEVYDWRRYREVDGLPLYRLPQAAICLPLDIEVVANMHHKLQHGDPMMLAIFNRAVDHGKGVHPSVADGAHRTGL